MTLSIWRFAHLALAVISSIFLLALSITGVILAVDAIDEKRPAYRAAGFDTITVVQVIPLLREVYPDIIEVSVDHNQFVTIDAMDGEGNRVNAYINPLTGEVLGDLRPKSQFIQWTIALHRSLFLKETGRVIVGVVSFLLLLITVSGMALIIKRQQGVRRFLAKIKRDSFNQYFHAASGRLLLVPVFVIALTGTHLFLVRVNIIAIQETKPVRYVLAEDMPSRSINEFSIFKKTLLSDVERIEFPFVEDDPEEFYVLKLKDRALSVHQLSGEVVEETVHPYASVLEKLSLDIHTGRTNAIWAAVLGLASANILFFIYTGFVITFRRTRTRIKNRFTAETAEIILLVGTENGSTLFIADQIHRQLLADGKRAYLTEMNRYAHYPNAQQLLIFTSTHGLGAAPASATEFERLVRSTEQRHPISFSVVGFGSRAYPDFCGYAALVDEMLTAQPWASRYLDLHTVNDRSTEEFVRWARAWSEKSSIALSSAPTYYNAKTIGQKTMRVVSRTRVSTDNQTFSVLFRPAAGVRFKSGDLLAVYPESDHRERLYSIGRHGGMIQLTVKLHPAGLGSNYLYRLEVGQKILARIAPNPLFHFPRKTPAVVMIANGTGIAPFLGMVMENRKKIPIRLYAGFRNSNALTERYQRFAMEQIANKNLTDFRVAYSREGHRCYVMDLIRNDAEQLSALLKKGSVIMICGSLAMQRDVEIVIEEICLMKNMHPLSHYKARGQLLTDCY